MILVSREDVRKRKRTPLRNGEYDCFVFFVFLIELYRCSATILYIHSYILVENMYIFRLSIVILFPKTSLRVKFLRTYGKRFGSCNDKKLNYFQWQSLLVNKIDIWVIKHFRKESNNNKAESQFKLISLYISLKQQHIK